MFNGGVVGSLKGRLFRLQFIADFSAGDFQPDCCGFGSGSTIWHCLLDCGT